MPSLDPRFVQVPPLQDYFVDKDTGFPLSAGIVTFYEDNDHTVLKPVYQLSAGPNNTYVYNVLPDPMQLSSVGTFIDENGNDIVPYFFPYNGTPDDSDGTIDLYYITVYSSAGVLQFTRDAWPNVTAVSAAEANITENLISNPQFSQVSFNPNTASPGYTFSVTGSNIITEIAPDWVVVTSGTGTVTVQQIATAGNSVIPSNPSYLLDITSASVTSISLRQRLTNAPRLFYDGFANGSFVAESQDGATHQITMSFVPSILSGPAVSYVLVDVVIPATGYSEYTGTAAIDGVINTDSSTVGYVDIVFTFNPGAHIQLTSVQLVEVPNVNSTTNFIEQTPQRELDHLFHYFYNSILFQPKDTILTGWDFGLNPFQFNSNTLTTQTVNAYVADQTILIQQAYVASTTGSNVQTGRAATADNFNLQVKALTANNQFALIQYVDPNTFHVYWSSIVSSLLNARISTVNSTQVKVKMRVISNPALPNTISQVDPIASWTAGQDPVFAAGWTAIPPIAPENDPVYTLGSTYANYAFNNFILPAATTGVQTVGVVIYTVSNMQSTGTADSVIFNSCSLVPNRFAIATPPKTFDATLNECQFYYEDSYDVGILAGAVTATGQRQQLTLSVASSPNLTVYAQNLQIIFDTEKRANVGSTDLTLYSPSGLINSLQCVGFNGGGASFAPADILSSNFTFTSTGTKVVTYISSTSTFVQAFSPLAGIGTNWYGYFNYHYVVDVRLGK